MSGDTNDELRGWDLADLQPRGLWLPFASKSHATVLAPVMPTAALCATNWPGQVDLIMPVGYGLATGSVTPEPTAGQLDLGCQPRYRR